jgi:osmotically-inducible protein OsmY
MKSSFTRIAAAALFAAVLAGCSSTPTSSGTGEWIDDTWITTKVKTQLIGDTTVSGTSINVETFRGVVQLSGFAATQAEINAAVKLAGGVSGVKSVKNDIRLRSAPPR